MNSSNRPSILATTGGLSPGDGDGEPSTGDGDGDPALF
jgi:hypothetical protein